MSAASPSIAVTSRVAVNTPAPHDAAWILRSAVLTKVGVSTEAFVGTNAMIGLLVDVTRVVTYAGLFVVAGSEGSLLDEVWPLIVTGAVAAFAGVLLGKRFLKKVTMDTVQTITGVLLIGIAFALGSGIL